MGNNKNNLQLNIKHSLMAGCVVAIMYLAMVIICQITPFGNDTFLMYDLKRQYIDYYSYAKTILQGQNHPFFSFATTLGSGMLGFNIYYISSPFLIILLLFPQAYLPMGITFIIGIKLILAAIIMDIFIQYYLQKSDYSSLWEIHSIVLLLPAISWAFSSFLVAHSMNMMWMDVVILLPFFVYGIDRVIIDNKKLPYILCLILMLWCNYYITYQVLLFAVLWTILRLWIIKSKHFLKAIGNMIIATIIPPLIEACILIPTALELANSPKDITQLGLELKGKNLAIVDILSKLPAASYDYIEARFGEPQIYCGVLLIIIGFLFFMNQNISKRERAGFLALFSLFMLSFSRDIINLIWHAGMEPSGHPYRQAFMFIFLMILCCARVLNDLDNIQKMCAPIAIIFSAAIFYFGLRTRYDHISDFTQKLNIVLLMVYGVLICLYFWNPKWMKSKLRLSVLLLLVILQISELVLNAGYTYKWQSMQCETQDYYKETIDKTSKAVEYVKSQDDSFYRMENLNPRQQNDAMQYNYNGITHYSSAGMTYVRYFLQKLGFNDDGLYTHYGHNNTMTADSLFGIKYILTDNTFRVHPQYNMFYEDKESVYENPYSLGIAIGTNDFDKTGISNVIDQLSSDDFIKYIPSDNPFSLQEDIYSRIVGKSVKLFTYADVNKEIYAEDDGNLNAAYKVTVKKDGELYMYLNGIGDKTQGLAVYIGDELIDAYGNNYSLKILNLGYYKAGSEVEVTVYGGSPEADFGSELFATEDVNALKEAYQAAAKNNCSIDRINSRHLRVYSKDVNGILMTIPCQEGWRIKIDGKQSEVYGVYSSLIYLELPNDNAEHTIDMIFVPKGFDLGLAISLVGLILLALIIYGEKRRSVSDEG